MPDYVIVGGGSAGCVLAARLSEDPDVDVLLLEAGPADKNPYIHMPVGFFKMTDGPLTWGYKTAPQRHANNREVPYAQGRVLGGGGSINAEVFTRGCPEDYDRWANEEGCDGWSFEDVKPYYVKSEDNDVLADEYRGAVLMVSHVCPLISAIAMWPSAYCSRYFLRGGTSPGRSRLSSSATSAISSGSCH